MMVDEDTIALSMKADLLSARQEYISRGLYNCTKWVNELLYCMRGVNLPTDFSELPSLTFTLDDDRETYYYVKSLFDLKEYDRAVFYSKNSNDPLLQFMHCYSMYLSGEKKKMDGDDSLANDREKRSKTYLTDLHRHLTQLCTAFDAGGSVPRGPLIVQGDPWLIWLYGIVLKKLDLMQHAIEVFCKCLQHLPFHWGAWMELASLIPDKELLNSLKLPDHWMRKLFYAHVYTELDLNEEALSIYDEFKKAGLKDSSYILSQTAIAYDNIREVDKAIALFKDLEVKDPFCIDNMDTYSNLLYAKEMRVELAYLAHRIVEIDKYRVETCYIIGNYYSMRGQREKAAEYFERALRLNPQYLAAWILMGHEYMEMKNTNTSIQCYRRALEVNRREYRAWYGLGQAYEILKLHSYCLYYFKQAQKLKPNDSRTLVALGVSYEKVEKFEEARKCFLKAHSVGDIESIALLSLARLYSTLKEPERAAVVYERYLMETENSGLTEARAKAYLFLAEHCLQKNNLELAYNYAQKCTLFPETKEAGKVLLKDIANKRQQNQHLLSEAGTMSGRIHADMSLNASEASSSHLQPLNLTFTP